MLKAVIMAGGSGTRFWPLSRESLPKQFLKLHGERTLLQQAVDRIIGLVGSQGVLVLTNSVHIDRTREQLPLLPAENVIGEPTGRDTAACIALAAELCHREDPNARMAVLAADHVIEPNERFHAAVKAADAYLDGHPNALLTFGIRPAWAATGYGYLRRGELAGEFSGVRVYELQSFHEKPNADVARQFIESGQYYWNSGIFVWNARTILAELDRQAPAIVTAIRRIADAWAAPNRAEVFAAEYSAIEKKSIDYAVMENAAEVAMVEAPFSWDDVGSWLALERVRPKNEVGNVVIGQHLGIDTAGCIIVGEAGHLVGTIGVKDLIIVQTPDVTLVANRKDEQAVKTLQQQLSERGYSEFR